MNDKMPSQQPTFGSVPIPLKQWLTEEASRQGLSIAGMRSRVYGGRYEIKVKRKNQRVVFVVEAKLKPAWAGQSLKQWLREESDRTGRSVHAIRMRLWRGKYPYLVINANHFVHDAT